jgi:hypothetical protein
LLRLRRDVSDARLLPYERKDAMKPEHVIEMWIENHPYISTPEWGAQNLIGDLYFYGYEIVKREESDV